VRGNPTMPHCARSKTHATAAVVAGLRVGETLLMVRGEVNHYFRQRSVLSAFIVLPCVSLCFLAARLAASWLDPHWNVVVLLCVVGLLAGFTLRRLALALLMGPDD